MAVEGGELEGDAGWGGGVCGRAGGGLLGTSDPVWVPN